MSLESEQKIFTWWMKENLLGETWEEGKVEEPNIENDASTQTDPEDYSPSCSTPTAEYDYMFRIHLIG